MFARASSRMFFFLMDNNKLTGLLPYFQDYRMLRVWAGIPAAHRFPIAIFAPLGDWDGTPEKTALQNDVRIGQLPLV